MNGLLRFFVVACFYAFRLLFPSASMDAFSDVFPVMFSDMFSEAFFDMILDAFLPMNFISTDMGRQIHV